MELGMVGLGRMGANMVRRLMRDGHALVAHDLDAGKVAELEREGARGAKSLRDLVGALRRPRHVWVMLPAGAVTEAAIAELAALLEPGDLVVDGGNTHFKDDVRRARELGARELLYLDVGVSGGVWGLERGYCLMVGGPAEGVERMQGALRSLAPGRGDVPPAEGRTRGGSAEEGWLHCGPAGAGHYVKMVHNGIEYGVMQAYAEGFDLMRSARGESVPEDLRYRIDVADVAELWRRGSVIGSWLLDLTASALAEDPDLERFDGHVQDSGEGRWTVQAAVEQAVPAPVLTDALYARFRSRQQATFADKCLSAMRYKFGGHVEPKGSS